MRNSSMSKRFTLIPSLIVEVIEQKKNESGLRLLCMNESGLITEDTRVSPRCFRNYRISEPCELLLWPGVVSEKMKERLALLMLPDDQVQKCIEKLRLHEDKKS
jgi:hypothetical protein